MTVRIYTCIELILRYVLVLHPVHPETANAGPNRMYIVFLCLDWDLNIQIVSECKFTHLCIAFHIRDACYSPEMADTGSNS